MHLCRCACGRVQCVRVRVCAGAWVRVRPQSAQRVEHNMNANTHMYIYIYIYIYIWYPLFPLRCHGKRLRISSTKALYCTNVSGPKEQKRCTVPRKPIFLSQNKQKCCTVPKNPKNQSLETLGAKWLGALQTLVFLVSLGQYSIFALFALKTLVFGTVQHSVQHFGGLGLQKRCTVPKKTNVFKAKTSKHAVLSKKTKKAKV